MRPVVFLIGVALFALACNDDVNAINGMCSTSGATKTVSATDGLVFSPTTTTIKHGQSVCWQNTGTMTHVITSDDQTSFASTLATGESFAHIFPTVGTFVYRCTNHAGMLGTITVN